MAKPFSLEELVARVHAVLRRHGRPTPHLQVTVRRPRARRRRPHASARAGEPIDLSPTEYKLLRFLLGNPGRVLSRAQILDHVWEYDFGGDASVVETYIGYLRKKVDQVDPPLIHTVRGVGYTLRTS